MSSSAERISVRAANGEHNVKNLVEIAMPAEPLRTYIRLTSGEFLKLAFSASPSQM